MTTPAPPPEAQPAGRPFPLALAAWAFIGLVLVLAVALVAVKLTAGPPRPAPPAAAPAPASVVAAVAGLAPAAFDAAGGSAATGAEVLAGQPPLRAGRRVEVVFVGAESSPFSAAASWALVAALSRFGTFSHLGWSPSAASEVFARTPGFSFDGAVYRSPDVALEAVERDRATLSLVSSPGYPPLQGPDAAVEALLGRFDGPGEPSLPFLDVGNRLLMVGAASGVAPGLLQGQSLAQVAARLAVAADPVGQAVLGAADQIAAAICAGDGASPPAVCASPGVRAAAQDLALP
jgi:hypothetical protein